jgi:hypothetical protein
MFELVCCVDHLAKTFNRGTVFSVSSRRCYWQDKLRVLGLGQFGNPEEGERPLLEAATKQQLVRT